MKIYNASRGYTLVELMVTVGILGIVTAIAIPTYNGYVNTAAMGTAETNADILAGFQDSYYYENETYLAGSYIPPGANGLAALGWNPSGDKENFDYVVAPGATGITSSYIITVKYKHSNGIVATVTKP